nr:MAG TPA: hypothetical protein [Caudoviricetes sp.]
MCLFRNFLSFLFLYVAYTTHLCYIVSMKGGKIYE